MPVVELNFRKALEAFSPATVAAQAADLGCFTAFCGEQGRGGPPADAGLVVAYVEHLEQQGLRPATIRRHLASLAAAHGYLGAPSPTSTAVVVHALKGLRRGDRSRGGQRPDACRAAQGL